MVKKKKKRPFYMGLDLSYLQTGLVFADIKAKNVLSSSICSDPKATLEQRIHYIWSDIKVHIRALRASHPLRAIAMEGVAMAGKGQRALQLAGLHFYVRVNLRLILPKTKIVIIPPTTLKKWVTGGGHSQKDKMMLSCYKRWDYEPENSDVCDAFCLTRYYLANRKSIKKEWWVS